MINVEFLKQFDINSPQSPTSYLVFVEDKKVIYNNGNRLIRCWPGHYDHAIPETINGYKIYEFLSEDDLKAWISRNSNLKFVIKFCASISYNVTTKVELQ